MSGGNEIGRNDPCPCGSGEKYERCCLREEESMDAEFLRLRRISNDVLQRVLEYAEDTYPEDVIYDAWDEFTLWGEEGDDPDDDPSEDPKFVGFFLPWMAFRWDAREDAESEDEELALPEKPLAAEFLERLGVELEEDERRYLEVAVSTPFSFHSVIESEPGRAMRLTDLMTDEVRQVLDPDASRAVQRGDILLARVVEVDGSAIVDGCAPLLLPVEAAPLIAELRAEIGGSPAALDARTLYANDFELRGFYLNLARQLADAAELVPAREEDDDES